MAFGDVDTLGLTFDKLQYIFNGYGQIYESFTQSNTASKQGGISESEFFESVQQGVLRFSALEFLAIKALFEIKKSMDMYSGPTKWNARQEDRPNPPVPGTGYSVASFISAKSLPGQNLDSMTKKDKKICFRCGNQIKRSSKFCSICGNKV